MSHYSKCNIHINTNGLGEVISKRKTNQFGYQIFYWFRPYNGVKIDKYHYKYQYDYYNGPKHEYKEDEYDQKCTWQPSEKLNSIEQELFPDKEPFDISLSNGSFFDFSNTIFGDGGPDIKDITYTIIGSRDQYDIKSISNGVESSYEKCISFGDYLYVHRKTYSPVTYTNIVRFHGKYDLDGTETPLHESMLTYKLTEEGNFSHEGTFVSSNSSSAWSLSSWNITTSYLKLNMYIAGKDIRTILLYSDCSLICFKNCTHYNDIQDQKLAQANKSYYVYTSNYIKNEYKLAMMRVPSIRLKYNRKFLYSFPEETSNNEDENMISDFTETVPKEHRWAVSIFSTSNKCCIIRCIKKGQTFQDLDQKINVDSKYARYTDYWVSTRRLYTKFSGHNNYDTSGTEYKVFYKSEDIKCDDLYNRAFYPIIKPYLECDLIINEEEDSAFPISALRLYRRLIRTKNLRKYRKSLYLNSNTQDLNESRQTFLDFGKTISPFKNFIANCHGSRNEYDKDRVSDTKGRSVMCVTYGMENNQKWYRHLWSDRLKTLFKTSKYWNAWDTHDTKYLCLGVIIESCFSGGIRDYITRAPLQNTVFTDIHDIIPDYENIFYAISALATRPAWSLSGIDRIIHSAISYNQNSYKQVTEFMKSNITRICKTAFECIKDFFNENYDFMYSCLDSDEKKELWSYTKNLILNDLTNNFGRKYFCFFEKFDKDSDCYFIPEQRKYNIFDSYAGLISIIINSCKESDITPQLDKIISKFFMKSLSELDSERQIEIMEIDPEYESRRQSLKEKILQFVRSLYLNVNSVSQITYSENATSLYIAQQPTSGCLGLFAEQDKKIFENPHPVMKEWLSSDDDLAELENISQETSGGWSVSPVCVYNYD